MATTHAEPLDHEAAPGPSIRQQIVRATAGTLGVVAALGLAAAAYTYGASPAAAAWWRIAGDPDLVLAEGFDLSADAPDAAMLVWSAPTTAFASELDTYSAELGGGARLVASGAELESVAPYASGEIATADEYAQGHVAVARAGVLRLLLGTDQASVVQLYAGPDAPVAATEEEQADLVARMGESWLEAAGSTVSVAVVPRRLPTTEGGMWTAEYQVPGCDVCFVSGLNIVRFDESGRLSTAVMGAVAFSGTEPVAVISAAQAFDDARHRRDGTDAFTAGLPMVTARLMIGDISTTVVTGDGTSAAAGVNAWWIFEDAAGTGMATAPAADQP